MYKQYVVSKYLCTTAIGIWCVVASTFYILLMIEFTLHENFSVYHTHTIIYYNVGLMAKN